MGNITYGDKKIAFPEKILEKLSLYLETSNTTAEFQIYLNSKMRLIDPQRYLKRNIFVVSFYLNLFNTREISLSINVKKIYNGITGETELELGFRENVSEREIILNLLGFEDTEDEYCLYEINSQFLDFLLTNREYKGLDVLLQTLCFLKKISYEDCVNKQNSLINS